MSLGTTELEDYIRGGGEYITYHGVRIPFDKELALRRGLFISGGKGSGKTNLMKIFTEYLMGQTIKSSRVLTKGQPVKVVVKVIDSSQAWLKSSIPYYQVVESLADMFDGKIENPLDVDMVYDTSRLMPIDQKIFIGMLLEATFNHVVDNLVPIFIDYVLEESQMVLPSGSLRALWAQSALRHITVGRNYDLGFASLTQFPALVSTNVIKQSGLGYFGMCWEQNDKRKLQRFVCWKRDKVDQVFPNLSIGEFIFLKTGRGSKAFKIKTPEFKPKTTPQLWKPRQKPSRWQKLFKRRNLLGMI